MKLGVMVSAYREEALIRPVIHQYEGIADRIVVGVGSKPWKGTLPPDNTAQLARLTEAKVYEKPWESEPEQWNFLMDKLRDMDYVIVSHADTFFLQEDLEKLKQMNLTKLHYTCRVFTYWKDYDTVIDPDISLPTIIVRSDAVFDHMINIKGMEADPESLPITCYHLSWAKTNESIKSKISSYSHAGEIDYSWFDTFKNWKQGDTDFAPTVASDYKSTRTESLPDEIRNTL